MKKVYNKVVLPREWRDRDKLDQDSKRVFDLWYSLMTDCYHPQKASYNLCSAWLDINKFARGIRTLPGYDEWFKDKGSPLKLVTISKTYEPYSCCFN